MTGALFVAFVVGIAFDFILTYRSEQDIIRKFVQSLPQKLQSDIAVYKLQGKSDA